MKLLLKILSGVLAAIFGYIAYAYKAQGGKPTDFVYSSQSLRDIDGIIDPILGFLRAVTPQGLLESNGLLVPAAIFCLAFAGLVIYMQVNREVESDTEATVEATVEVTVKDKSESQSASSAFKPKGAMSFTPPNKTTNKLSISDLVKIEQSTDINPEICMDIFSQHFTAAKSYKLFYKGTFMEKLARTVIANSRFTEKLNDPAMNAHQFSGYEQRLLENAAHTIGRRFLFDNINELDDNVKTEAKKHAGMVYDLQSQSAIQQKIKAPQHMWHDVSLNNFEQIMKL